MHPRFDGVAGQLPGLNSTSLSVWGAVGSGFGVRMASVQDFADSVRHDLSLPDLLEN
jgi:hypothetical protein